MRKNYLNSFKTPVNLKLIFKVNFLRNFKIGCRLDAYSIYNQILGCAFVPCTRSDFDN